ncbi:hypothetical protein SARC_09872 [Sphaeroforma arctica JP610]|uniref:Uncharacterized protein n=1 Tax=Sphaeroforma arctica JP610 TaxID=667725 RepID=A0A0L0FLL8_9EUKA|nr:hypothetical protein SARC_09872 [Sphaeroforma arctica JP610]KNC77672.1 hypothetical protein SARC_09872 [Sphaeroforma arctica JP610]|eukprot:XP_014151574.1 hypothetical protein SARC_09872 [Sphaeroforma arctica JP610]
MTPVSRIKRGLKYDKEQQSTKLPEKKRDKPFKRRHEHPAREYRPGLTVDEQDTQEDLLSQSSSTKQTQDDSDTPEADEPTRKNPHIDGESDPKMEAYVAAFEKKSSPATLNVRNACKP